MEKWQDIDGYNGFYQVSSYGNLKGYRKRTFESKDRIRKLTLEKSGYVTVGITVDKKFKKYLVHILVAKHFIPNPENKEEVNHINGIKSDNRVENLEWCTPSENLSHAYKLGLFPSRKGNNNPNSHYRRNLKKIAV
jgi:hypothetical protein